MPFDRRRLLMGAAAALGAPGLLCVPSRARTPDGFTELRIERRARAMTEGGKESELWTYNGTCPGPEIRVRKNERVKVRLINRLDEPTTIHWHGIRIDNAMDGSPLTQNHVRPGETFDYDFAVPDAGTYWYHPHVGSPRQVEKGLYGALIVEEDAPLPEMSELVLVLDDWLLDDDGGLLEGAFGDIRMAAHGGRLGNWFTVDGLSRPRYALDAGRPARLRIVNVSNARVMNLQFKGAEPVVLALDGQPLAKPFALADQPLELGPGGRADVGVGRGTSEFILANVTRNEPLEIAYFDRTGNAPAAADQADFAPLPSNGLPGRLDLGGVAPRRLVMEGGAMGGLRGARLRGRDVDMRELVQNGMAWAMNGVAGMTEDAFATYELGETALIEFVNKTAWPHAMHLHGHHVLPVDDAGAPLPPGAWRDTVVVAPDATLRVAFTADNPGKWMMHCHMLEHQASGMMTWFEVAAPG